MEVRTEIEIAAPRARVWEAIVDLPAYSEWNPFVPRVVGRLQEGERLDVVLALPGGSENALRPEVLSVVPDEELRLRHRFVTGGLFEAVHFLKLLELSPDRTRVVHGANFTGLLLKTLTSTVTRTTRGFVFMNQALKRRVEEAAPRDAHAP